MYKLYIEIVTEPVFTNFYTRKLHWAYTIDIAQAKVIGDVKYRNDAKYYANIENYEYVFLSEN